MLSSPQVRDRLAEAAEAAFGSDRSVLYATASWLNSVSARELLRIDSCARQAVYRESMLGPSKRWIRKVLPDPLSVVNAVASMHPDGQVRERAVQALSASPDPLTDRALAVRVTDHVRAIRETATREVLRRISLDHADRIMPLLHRIEQRGRGADVVPLYLRALVAEHGEVQVWSRLRKSTDYDLRRAAIRQSFDSGLLGLDDAVAMFPAETDQLVRRMLLRIIADSATFDAIADLLLHARSAESRVMGLVRLTAEELDPADVERLLVDTSVLVRLWARRRWQEMGQDPATTYAGIAASAPKPAVRARAYLGLAEIGAPIAREEILELVNSDEPSLRKIGLTLLRGAAIADDIPLLLALVAGTHSRVARLASEVLTRSPQLWSLADLAPLKASPDPEHRRRAWQLHRNRSGWEAVIADLELLHDADQPPSAGTPIPPCTPSRPPPNANKSPTY